MASPISVGDAYLMGKVAFQLGRAFTKGRKSAPAEFREVENQLYSLSAALQSFKTASRDESVDLRFDASLLPTRPQAGDEAGGDDDVLNQVLRSCEQTLSHLESIVQKYGSIGKPRVHDTEQPRFKRWNDGLKHVWKTISWTTEGGDLASLRSNLTVHTNCLNLLLGAIVNSQTGRIEARVNDIDSMLYEIHAWFKENSKNSRLNADNASQRKAGVPSREDFELHESSNGTQSRLVCPHAIINPNLSLHEELASRHELFACQCSLESGAQSSHQTEVAAFSDMACIEESMERLTLGQAKQMLLQGLQTPLCCSSSGLIGSQQALILNTIGDIRECKGLVESVKFFSKSSGQRTYERRSVDSIQILHYKSTDLKNFLGSEDTFLTILSSNDYAEIVIRYSTSQGDADIVETRVRSLSIFRVRVDEMQTELFVLTLRYPRTTEKKLLAIQAYDVHTETVHISDAEISILQDTESSGFRLTIISRDGHTIVSQELAEDFFDSSLPHKCFRFNSPTYIAQIDSYGLRTISKINTGFSMLGFSDAAVERLFSLSLTGVTKTTQPRIDLGVVGSG
ncbi:hypothetical protein MGYG_04486 [Nannizzia gypsea CBS 118893]|uniref:Fungal N-terminal domain-containing protein n=1 Tax=Arthroderma gypseum (strain ATCC MYA-4604 / CBS 118893) TaxID=535722 RepID=E4UT82_ARTGP|nr:hypothetical protein MGYG_04486 [Nannizzia gypsea CBS 118893]EFR01478.1 hypothetical protein MGYG_04486 [Nannizzia gypsea CBS 118893]